MIYYFLISGIIAFIINFMRSSLHEFGHYWCYKKYGIHSEIKLLPNFHCSISKENYQRFNDLPISSKKNIMLIGPVIDFIVVVISISSFIMLESYFAFGFLMLFILSLYTFCPNASPSNKSDYGKYLFFKNGGQL